MFKLSIITINLNNANGLRKTILSIVNQTFVDYEYIIIDGKSKDGSLEIIKEYSEKITYWISELDTGIYNAMNKGIQKSTGEIITFLNSGDEYYSPHSLEMVLSFLKIKLDLAELFFFDFIYQTGGNKTLISSLDVTNKYIISYKGFGHPSTFYKRNIFETLSLFDESYEISADRAFYMKAIVQNKMPFAYFPFAVSVFHDGGLSSNIDNLDIMQKEDKNILNNYYSSFEKRIIVQPLFRRVIQTKYISNLLINLLHWKLNRV